MPLLGFWLGSGCSRNWKSPIYFTTLFNPFFQLAVFKTAVANITQGLDTRFMKDIKLCTLDGRPSRESIQEPLSTTDLVKHERMKASENNVTLRNPDFFVAGEVYHHFNAWDAILHGSYKKDKILRYISEGVLIYPFFKCFKGDFKGNHSNSPSPPRMIFENSKICHQYQDFISETILERICNGPIFVWGKEGTCEPPHLVMPLTKERSKTRMCHDKRFLNLWMDTPHSAHDTIADIH